MDEFFKTIYRLFVLRKLKISKNNGMRLEFSEKIHYRQLVFYSPTDAFIIKHKCVTITDRELYKNGA